MELTVKDRVYLMSLLPRKGNLKQMQIKSKLREKLDFTEKETEEIEMKVLENNNVVWNPSKATLKEVELEEEELNLIKHAIDLLDKEESVTDDLLLTVEKFL